MIVKCNTVANYQLMSTFVDTEANKFSEVHITVKVAHDILVNDCWHYRSIQKGGCNSEAVHGITDDLSFITKQIDANSSFSQHFIAKDI